ELLDHSQVAVDVSLVERGVNFVENAERAGLALEDRQEQRNGRHCLFAPRKERNAAQLFSGRAGDHVDAALQDVIGVFEDDVSLAPAKELAEQLFEVLADLRKAVEKNASALDVDAADDFLEGAFGFDQVLKLAGEAHITGLELVELFKTVAVHLSELLEL